MKDVKLNRSVNAATPDRTSAAVPKLSLGMLWSGKTTYIYFLPYVTAHRDALAGAIFEHRRMGYDPAALSSALIQGACTDPACTCGGRRCVVRYGLNPTVIREVIHPDTY